MKKIKSFMLIILASFFMFPFSAKAEDEKAEIVSSYYTGENLYVFIKDNALQEYEDTVDLLYNNTRIETAAPESIASLQVQRNYMFLIDLSTSMPNYREKIIQLSDALLSNSQNQNSVTVCGFGEKFEVIAENITLKEDVEKTLNNLNFNHEATDIRGGVINALRYVADNKIENGAVSNLIIMTDAVPWIAGKKYDISDIEEIKQAIAQTPETIVHSVIFGSSPNEDFKSAFSWGKGISNTIENKYNNNDAVNVGHSIAEYVNGLTVLNFKSNNIPDIYDHRFDCELLLNSDDGIETPIFLTIEINNIRNYLIPLPKDVLAAPEIDLPLGETEPTVETDYLPNTSEEVPQDPLSSEIISGETNTTSESIDKKTSFFWVCVILIIILIIVIAIAIYVLLKRNSYLNKTNTSGNITMRLELLNGNAKVSKHIFSLNNNLIIGSDRTCDIVMKAQHMPPKAAKIFLREQSIFIESLSSDVFIEGIQIYEPNRIRSGDRITIENIILLFRF